MKRSRFLALISGALVFPSLPSAAQEDWPKRFIRIILPDEPGGTSDILLRRLTWARSLAW
jgi:tripartite-type tricarboxylate transporter receptor subunit TctC